MKSVAELELPAFDYTDPDIRGPRFHEEMAALRERHWLARQAGGEGEAAVGAVFTLDRDAASFFLRSKATTFPGQIVADVFGLTEGPLYEQVRHNILHVNGEDHRRLRNLVNPAFTPRAADRWRPAMRGFLAELWERVEDEGRCEFVESFAKAYPSLTIATVMGAPLEAAPRLHEWSTWIQRQFSADLIAQRERIEQACAEFYEFAGELLAARRETPGDDLISTLIAARDGEDRLNDVELVNLVLNVLVGGVDTTQSQLAQAMRLFAEHPEQWRALRSDPGLVGAAVEEVLRYEPITPFTARITLTDVEYRDVLFPESTLVMVCAASANRDASVAPDADRFDITAAREGHPYTFGAGIHYCLGSNLAKAELEEALLFLAERMPGLALDGEPDYDSINGIYGMLALPIRW